MQLDTAIKKEFPVFAHNPDLVFLDSAASTQKPRAVINAVGRCYETYYANVHRGIYQLSERSSEAYEDVREKTRAFINAASFEEIIFTRNTTESINLVAYSWGRQNIVAGDEILITEMEHHANIVPWQQLVREKGARLKFIPITAEGRLNLAMLDELITAKTKLVAFTHMSNVLGTINPVKEIIAKIRTMETDTVVLVDGAQSVPHFPVDVQGLDADFYVFSSHKMMGPTGVGVLYGKTAILQKMPPFLTGGDMIVSVTRESAEWNQLPYKFEAGTPAIAEVIGFGAAIDYITNIGLDKIFAHEEELTKQAMDRLASIDGVTVYGPQEMIDRGGTLSFTIGDIHPHDLASIYDEQHVAVRAGHHCAQPLHEKLGLSGTTRASFYLYNTPADVEALVRATCKAKELFS